MFCSPFPIEMIRIYAGMAMLSPMQTSAKLVARLSPTGVSQQCQTK
ncbi:hypothetical protein X727_17405 [Mesorhizobium sp. L103C119B0]|nr:hypothetical protein X765_30770 [Mesorhizobium sp. LSHC440B00]ESX34498.1 hypothetical protein X763_21575 [Mesorhizobium sp. LSHC432A00]ESX70252.1 hypothetical protein X757_26145 [Mesorhizobium sp. LSHC414A00]ESZ69546.1 hypothetical protein X727_17405 [Mesorhizobium sp. L103C119B0]